MKQWEDIWHKAKVKHMSLEEFIAANAARDRDLAAACSSMPPSKEQALAAFYAIATGANDIREQLQDLDTIRQALEQLP